MKLRHIAMTFVITTALFIVSIWPHVASGESTYSTVSILGLIANPARYNGQRVQTLGFLCIAEEEETLYVNEEDYLHGLATNSIALKLTESQRRKAEAMNLRYVIVEGTISRKDEGDLGSATLVNLHRLDEWKHHRQPPPNASGDDK